MPDIYELLEDMKPFVHNRDWPALETHFHNLAMKLAGKRQATAIANLDFTGYQQKLEPAFADAIAAAEELEAMAIYFEYDLDNNWNGTFFLCHKYNPEELDDEDWACDWLCEIEAPDFIPASQIYLENEFDTTDNAKGSTLYLVARTTAAFGRCFDKRYQEGAGVCIAFHDGTIIRLAEPRANRRPMILPPKKIRPRQKVDEVGSYVLKHYFHLLSPQEQTAYHGTCIPDEMPEQFLQAIANRLLADYPTEVFVNRCPTCQRLCRTPQARQCPSGAHRW